MTFLKYRNLSQSVSDNKESSQNVVIKSFIQWVSKCSDNDGRDTLLSMNPKMRTPTD